MKIGKEEIGRTGRDRRRNRINDCLTAVFCETDGKCLDNMMLTQWVMFEERIHKEIRRNKKLMTELGVSIVKTKSIAIQRVLSS